MSLNQLKTACQACTVCDESDGEDSELLAFESDEKRILFVIDQRERPYFNNIREILSSRLGKYSITFSTRCPSLSSEISLSTCGVYTKLLLKFFPIVWMGQEGAKQLNLKYEPGKILRIEGCVIYFGSNCIDDSEINQLKTIDADYTNLKNLIGG